MDSPCRSPDSRPPGMESAMWRGVLFEEEYLDARIEGGFQLKSGTYVPVLGTNRYDPPRYDTCLASIMD